MKHRKKKGNHYKPNKEPLKSGNIQAKGETLFHKRIISMQTHLIMIRKDDDIKVGTLYEIKMNILGNTHIDCLFYQQYFIAPERNN